MNANYNMTLTPVLHPSRAFYHPSLSFNVTSYGSQAHGPSSARNPPCYRLTLYFLNPLPIDRFPVQPALIHLNIPSYQDAADFFGIPICPSCQATTHPPPLPFTLYFAVVTLHLISSLSPTIVSQGFSPPGMARLVPTLPLLPFPSPLLLSFCCVLFFS